MKFIDFLQEDGEISTANIAGARGSLFGGVIKRTANCTKFKKNAKIKRVRARDDARIVYAHGR